MGWIPSHVLVHAGDRLAGATPAYLKLHSQGEFVFDWSWAEAYTRHGLEYYPKLVSAIPFTPSTGPRLLVHPDASRHEVRRALAASGVQVSKAMRTSSFHWLFPCGAGHRRPPREWPAHAFGMPVPLAEPGLRRLPGLPRCADFEAAQGNPARTPAGGGGARGDRAPRRPHRHRDALAGIPCALQLDLRSQVGLSGAERRILHRGGRVRSPIGFSWCSRGVAHAMSRAPTASSGATPCSAGTGDAPSSIAACTSSSATTG